MLIDCLVVQQPYASLIAYGKKRWEFRNNDTQKRGLIGIAASPNAHLSTLNAKINYLAPTFPKGVILAVGELTTSFYVTSADLKSAVTNPIKITIHGHELELYDEPLGEPIEDVQSAINNKNWTKYAWLFENIRLLKTPVKYEKNGPSTWVKVDIDLN